LAALNPRDASSLVPLIGDPVVPAELRASLARSFGRAAQPDAFALIADAMRTYPYRIQLRLAQTLAANRAGAEKLLKLIEDGHAPARLLLERQVKDKVAA